VYINLENTLLQAPVPRCFPSWPRFTETVSSLGYFARTIGSLLIEINFLAMSRYCRTPFGGFAFFSLRPYKSYEKRGISHHTQSATQMEGIHMMGCCPVSRRDYLLQCYHHLSAMQLSAQYLRFGGPELCLPS
jgi:hypothetical protein